MTTQPLIINNFDQAIADSPHKGFGLMSRVDISEYPGAVKAGKSVASIFHTSTTKTFTADASTDICTGSGFTTNANTTSIAVYLTTTNTLPAGLSVDTVYFIIRVDQGAGTFKLASTITLANAGTQIDITDTGTGIHTIHTVDPANINHIVKDERTGCKFMQDSNGRVWYYNDGSTTNLLHNSALDNGTGSFTNASGNGMVLFQKHDGTSTYWLLTFRNQLIDIIDIYGTSDKETPSWTNGWDFGGTSSDTTMNTGAGSSNSHYALVGQDDIVYFCDDRYVGSIKVATGQTFDPSNTATYTGNDQALDLPNNDTAQHLEELGTDLLIAGNNLNKIYPWDRISDSFNLPLSVPEKSVKKLKNIGNIVYILSGTSGNIYTTQGTYVRHFKKIPIQVTNNTTSVSPPVTWGGIDAVDGALLFGMATDTSGNSGAYLLYPDGRLILDQIASTGSTNILSFEVSNQFYYMGYSGGVDRVEADRYTNLEGVVQSAFYRVATKTEKATYSTLEIVVAKSVTGHVKIGYRNNTIDAFTNLDTFIVSLSDTDTIFKNDSIGLINIENIQIQAEIDDDVELVEIRLLP